MYHSVHFRRMLSFDAFLPALVAIFFTLVLYFDHAYSYFKVRGIPTLPHKIPFGNIINIVLLKQSINDKIVEVYNVLKSTGCKFGGMYFFTHPIFLPIDINLIKDILVKDFAYFNDRGIFYDEKHDPVSAHLFSLHGEKWKRLRMKLSPAFTSGKIKYMFDTINKCGNTMVHILKETCKTDNVIDIKDILSRYTIDVIGCCAFGIECNSLRDPKTEFRRMGNRAFTQTIVDFIRNVIIKSSPMAAKILRLSVFPSEVTRFFKNIVEDTITFRLRNGVAKSDFLQLLIKMMKEESLDENVDIQFQPKECPLTMNEAAAQASIFFLAGFETTSTSLEFTILELSVNRDMQEKARKEVLESIEKNGGSITYETISDLPYIGMILSESLRKYPPAPVYLRRCTKDYNIPDTDVTISKGTTIVIPTMAIQRDPEYFTNPNMFDPDRFSEESKASTKENAYIPFGEGPRKCIGMRFAMIQSKLALALLLKNFTFTLSLKTPLPVEMESQGTVLAPKKGIWIQLETL